ncbi:hypothetical protein [Tepidimicrobium xylanilyticum]|uniref:Uncharacterized protein n=1 Tax=Tepidimicrobium xylanilyticum TaxID=1123352 RepID=A0A1H3ATZ9_9FIRM|nr:hypothetical protein [Tepidimicrobium xylanilyticum]GMG97639.1 hypothetical protein EN5CB1_24650 [Tepidimicrobium xylanilyticum]SDX32319.1 hypothetical protein SAMN05660923_02115 [Tepidimicrobium xylanilyticum]
MKEFRILKLLDSFQMVFEKFGIDYPIMRRILQVKLTLDGRRIPTAMLDSSKGKEKDSSFLRTYGYTLFLKLF